MSFFLMWDSRTFRCQQKKNCMKKWNVGEAGRALWCISLIYYLPDFQTLILSTLEEESPFPFPFPPSPVSCSTCDIGAGLSVFSIDYHIFRALLGGTPADSTSRTTGVLFLEHMEYVVNKHSSHPSCLSAAWTRPLDTVWHFQVPSFLCLRCRPLNGVINVSPKGNFHSQLPKETVSCDAFLLDINRSREGQVMGGERAGGRKHQRQQASKRRRRARPVLTFALFTHFSLPSLNGFWRVNQINWLANYWCAVVFQWGPLFCLALALLTS